MKHKRKGKPAISEHDLQKAIKKYLRGGGRIQKLPDQKTVSPSLVGSRWSNTEVDMTQTN